MQLIRSYFNEFVELNDEEWGAFASCLKKRDYQKRTHILREGETCHFLAFIGEGSFRFYYLDDGNEKVTAFFFPGDFVSDYQSFLTGKPSKHNIEAMSNAMVHEISKDDLDELYDKYPAIERLGRLVAEKLFLSVTARLDSFLYDTPEKRYQDLLKRNSKLPQEVPQYMLASYLGVKPETLSRIRARI